jgi:hypothetical protein
MKVNERFEFFSGAVLEKDEQDLKHWIVAKNNNSKVS